MSISWKQEIRVETSIEIKVYADFANSIVFEQLVWKHYVYACVFSARLRMQDGSTTGLGLAKEKRPPQWHDTKLC
jgi:hypothetical protein